MQQREGSLHVRMTARLVPGPRIYRGPCPRQVQAKANIVLIELNHDDVRDDVGAGESDILNA